MLMSATTSIIVFLVVMLLSVIVLFGITTAYVESHIVLDVLEDNYPTNFREKMLSPKNYVEENLEDYVTEHLLKPPSDKPYNITHSMFNAIDAKRRASWKFFQQYVKFLFDDKQSGFFLEARARDGVTLSDTLWLETKMGWGGLLIEPDSANYLAMMKKNRKAWAINACLSTTQNLHFSIYKSVFTAFYKSSSTRGNMKWKWLFGGHSFGADTNEDIGLSSPHYFYEYSTVLNIPVGHLLKILNISVIDFFKLDTDGGELEVLELFPWDTVKLRTIVLKYNGSRLRTIDDLISFMEGKGYVLVYESPFEDYFFIHGKETSLLKKALD